MKKILIKGKRLVVGAAQKLWADYRHLLAPLLAVAAIYLIFNIVGISCPIKFLTGISCPGCGMTRALIHALRLDFAAAFFYHPLWIGLIPAVIAYFWLYVKGKEKSAKVLLIICGAALLIAYVLRMFFADGDVVVFHPEENLLFRIIEKIKGP
jgi:hypothetical protein